MDETSGAPVTALFLSPHFDDVALSCGGTVARAARRGVALVVTVFGGRPPGELNPFARFQHERWGHEDAVDERRREDATAMAILGARYLWLDYLDAIYRDHLYQADEELFGSVKPEDEPVERAIAQSVAAIVEQARPRQIYLPLSVGRHVDHQICTRLAPMLTTPDVDVLLYEDIPYALTPGAVEEQVEALGWTLQPTTVDLGGELERRLAAVGCYRSQLATIFRHYGEPFETIRRYAASVGGSGEAERFWRFVPGRGSCVATAPAPSPGE